MNTKIIRILLSIFVVTTFLSTAVFADEVWRSNVGEIIYEEDIGNTAVLMFATPGVRGSATRLYINGLTPDVYGRNATRGSYTGYWIDDSKRTTCEAELVSPKGTRSRSWGTLQITFRRSGNWWAFSAALGQCFGNLAQVIDARPAMADDTTSTVDPSAGLLITSTSVGEIRLGMTIAEARRYFEGAKFTQFDYSEEARWVEVALPGNRIVMRFITDQKRSEPNEDGTVPIDESARITTIEFDDPKYSTADGVRIGTQVKEVEKLWGKITRIELWDYDGSEHAWFRNAPSSFEFTLKAGPGAGEGAMAGQYGKDEYQTKKYNDHAVIETWKIIDQRSSNIDQ